MISSASDRIKVPTGLWEGLSQIGISTSDIADKTGLPLAVLTGPVVTTAQYYAVWQAYSDLIGNTAEAMIKLATAFETAKYPPSVLATYHARNYRDAINRMARYKQMCPPESLSIREEGELCLVELEWGNGKQPGPSILTGITLACLLELGRRGTGEPLVAQHVEFSHIMGDVRELEAYFGCSIRTGSDRNRLTLYCRDLNLPFISYNEELLEILTPVLDRSLDEQQHSSSLTGTVKWILKRSLTGGRLDMQAVAKELGLSSRSLQRRLTGEHTSFQQLLTEARHEQARNYLADPALDIKEVAFLVGYEDQNSFYRAFRLWEGDTPSHWRSVHLSSTRGQKNG
jgi:AraC-like DNA-binding protein